LNWRKSVEDQVFAIIPEVLTREDLATLESMVTVARAVVDACGRGRVRLSLREALPFAARWVDPLYFGVCT
jgi:hypothetical protein